MTRKERREAASSSNLCFPYLISRVAAKGWQSDSSGRVLA
jgi:hypothetical protein